ncbi:AbrB family transcriptional regulator [Peribacillus glennii]|uniref:AbrB family transcriptional regulator n=1 Tax=Peribacillus glennii TaxID=2303991 RepID=A0A372LKB4_9BACI|nr:AbrB family transcriptional regulator [Peribacillus glennii]RFU66646.1 AbrB family transcriptional regulator [Peribacillus glennii]
MKNSAQLIETYLIAFIGGYLFFLFQWPLPWILGPMTIMILWKSGTKRSLVSTRFFTNAGLCVLGIYFGQSFTKATFTTVTPYIIPFIMLTLLLITLSVVNSIFVTKYIKVDPVTSVLGSIPGGLPEMVAAGESLKANTSMVVVFQTIRLLTVVFLVPFIVIHLFVSDSADAVQMIGRQGSTDVWRYAFYIPGIALAWILRNKLPASFVIAPLFITAILGVSGVSLGMFPSWMLVAAQITVGANMGTKITVKDLKLGGKYSGIYFGLTILLIFLSFGMGYLFSVLTPLSLTTAILSFAPGGLVEMVLTANSVGADPAVVSSLQFIRLLFIILFVPGILKWFFNRKRAKMHL